MKNKIIEAVSKSPVLMHLAKRVWRSPWANRNPLFQRLILGQAATLQRQLAALRPGVSIETSLTCNARCPMCVHSEKEMVGHMSMALFEKLIAELVAWGYEAVGLSNYGEPLADPHWLERIELVRKAGLKYGFFSNGSLFREDVLTRMFELGGWQNVNFSVNGFSSEVYEKVMPPLKRDQVYQKLNMFLDLKQRRGGRAPFVTISCVIQADNAGELDDFKKYWQSRPGVDRVILADCCDRVGALQKVDQIGLPHYRKEVEERTWLSPCHQIWKSLWVYADGRVAPCCEDAALRRLIVGDANRTPLREIFLGPTLSALQDLHRQNRRSSHPICGRCRINGWWFFG